ncbi:fungal cellulose binding domain protein [Aspergillus fijiensis CBS 313.89]|uniref:AA9 family lytic polysaccharide monooxygenase n=1 Tax=Aspergillus fijiensis CBS 313.89 TaxID=1448319 RepID=A0A8G1RU74_9EURO|nr:fungal cellulose binding domain protein [Aspergillus fijiensis CBS 313.89]RAK79329.1 fungal cellulose binding domain protein [Aspergillus fijiensis CBS 313.89]
MKYIPLIVAVAASLARPATAHYIFSKLVLNGEESEDWQYIRETARSQCYMPTKYTSTFDNLTPSDSDFRCNLGSFSNAAKTEVAEVAAGDTIAMKLFYDGTIAHPGPGQVYMSKAPTGNVQEYEGDGDWFKIWEKTLCNTDGDLITDAWCAYGMSQFEFQIPASTPAGEYLVRAEHVGLHGAQSNEAEFFYSCAQIKVTGSGTGSPSLTYQIPGLYNDSMTLFNGLNLWTDSVEKVQLDILETPIGDDVWKGAGSASSSVASSTSSAYVAAQGTTTAAPHVQVQTTISGTTTPLKTASSTIRTSQYGQCGGLNWSGPTECETPYTCVQQNPYYHQCLNLS